MSNLDHRVTLLRERMDVSEDDPLVLVAVICNRCGRRTEAGSNYGGITDEFLAKAFIGWHLTEDPEDADLCPACSC